MIAKTQRSRREFRESFLDCFLCALRVFAPLRLCGSKSSFIELKEHVMRQAISAMRAMVLGAAVVGICWTQPASAQLAEGRGSDKKAAAATQGTSVPVKAVVLFSSGVGYFEHFGTVTGSGSTELRFKTQQINDILKSLVLQDLDGGKVTTISYPSQDPIAKTLRSFQVDITNNPSLGELLNQLRGARVKVNAGADAIEGTILGLEKKQKPSADKGTVEVWMLNLI